MIKILVVVVFLASCSSVKKVTKHLDPPKKDVDAFTVKWVKNLDPVYNNGNLPIGTSSPFIFDDIVYMGNLNGDMNAYDIETGRLIWSKKEGKPIQSQVNKYGEYIYYGSKTGRLYVRHYLTGKLKYSIDLGAPIESQPSFVSGRVVLHLRNHTVVTLDAATGKVFWRYKRSIPYTTTLQRVSHILPIENSMIVGFADGYLVSLSLEEGVINWEQKLSTGIKFVDVDVTPFYYRGYIIAGSAAGPLRMVNPQNGVIEKTIEFFQSHTPLLDNENLIIGSIFGEVIRVDRFGKVLNKRKISDDGISSIVKWKNGYAVTTMGNYILHINQEDFTVQSKYHLGSEFSAVFGNIATSENVMAVYSSRNRLYIFR